MDKGNRDDVRKLDHDTESTRRTHPKTPEQLGLQRDSNLYRVNEPVVVPLPSGGTEEGWVYIGTSNKLFSPKGEPLGLYAAVARGEGENRVVKEIFFKEFKKANPRE